jgi:hypothetical protein
MQLRVTMLQEAAMTLKVATGLTVKIMLKCANAAFWQSKLHP